MTNAKPLYKGHYLIALYSIDDDDEFQAVFTNANEMNSETYKSANTALAHYFHDRDRVAINYHHKKCVPYLIEAFEDDYGSTVQEFSDAWFNVFPDDTRTVFIQDGKETETWLTDERFEDCVIRKIRSVLGKLKIWLKKKVT